MCCFTIGNSQGPSGTTWTLTDRLKGGVRKLPSGQILKWEMDALGHGLLILLLLTSGVSLLTSRQHITIVILHNKLLAESR